MALPTKPTVVTSVKRAPSSLMPFEQFFCDAFIPLHGITIIVQDIHRKICRQLEAAFYSKDPSKYITQINCPPRVGKTMLLRAFIAWALGINPRSQWIYACYVSRLSEEAVIFIANIVKSAWYKALFPNTQIGDICQAGQFTTSANGRVFATSPEAGIIGVGAGGTSAGFGGIVMDDIQDPDDVSSRGSCEKTFQWYEKALKTRRNSWKFTPMINVQQRLSVDDMTGYLQKKYASKCITISLPALSLEGGKYISNIPAIASVEDLLDEKSHNPLEFNTLYQQNPSLAEGNLIPIRKFQYFDITERLNWDSTIITIDTAFGTKQANDFTCMQLWSKMGPKCFLRDMLHGKWTSPDVLANLKTFFEKHTMTSPVRHIIMEETISGIGFIQQMQAMGLPVNPVSRNKDKACRVEDVLTYIHNGCVYLPNNAPFVGPLIEECGEFRKDMKHRHDDIVDALADGITHTLGKPLTIWDVMDLKHKTEIRG